MELRLHLSPSPNSFQEWNASLDGRPELKNQLFATRNPFLKLPTLLHRGGVAVRGPQ